MFFVINGHKVIFKISVICHQCFETHIYAPSILIPKKKTQFMKTLGFLPVQAPLEGFHKQEYNTEVK